MALEQIDPRKFPGELGPAHGDFIGKAYNPMVAEAEARLVATETGVTKIDGSVALVGPFINESTERVLASMTIPAGALSSGDLMRWHFVCEVLRNVGSNFTQRIFVNGSNESEFTFVASGLQLTGFDFSQVMVRFVGDDPVTCRLADVFNGIDIIVDSTADITVEYRAQQLTDPANEYQSFFAVMAFLAQ